MQRKRESIKHEIVKKIQRWASILWHRRS